MKSNTQKKNEMVTRLGVDTINHYSTKVRVISLNTKPTRPKAELAKIRRYHASLSAIIVL